MEQTSMNDISLLELRHINKSFESPVGKDIRVLEDIGFSAKQNEIIGLLGRSGCGKSTLLRIISGLIAPTSGEALYLNKPIIGPVKGISMVFQSFALFPWLTVLQNVQTGLEAMNVPEKEMLERALEAINLIGLDGFEQAYPKELSGGMRQRVGFARAIVVHPAILLMDEPFSALDVLTAETLRNDFIDLWIQGQLPIKSVVMVTHSIEEAVAMCDRLVLLSSNPGQVVEEIHIDLPHPRKHTDPEVRKLIDSIYGLMTKEEGKAMTRKDPFSGTGLYMVLPNMATNRLTGLLETLVAEPYSGKADLPQLANHLKMEVDDLFPIADTLQLLRFAEVARGDIILTEAGRKFAMMDIQERKKLFASQLINYVPLAARIKRILEERPDHIAPFNRFLQELEDQLQKESAEQTMRTVITWLRYAEIINYDGRTQKLRLEVSPT